MDERAVIFALQRKHDELGALIGKLAVEGNTTACDILHGAQADLDRAMAIVADDDDDVSAALSCL